MDAVEFLLHDELHSVNLDDLTPETTLLQYLREFEDLRGTKYMCGEGGCGLCIVAVTTRHAITKRTVTFAVNSCLVPIYSCHGWHIETIEDIGNKIIGYHPTQERIAAFNGTQCGFCTPGWVMNMYALQASGKLTMKEVEESFGGNMCRCTGYRPILTAFKSLCIDADKKLLGEYPDIEDFAICGIASQKACKWVCKKKHSGVNQLKNNHRWYKVSSINEIFDILGANVGLLYQLVAGNTARGVYLPKRSPDIYIDVTNVEGLLGDTIKEGRLTIGANTTLTDTMEIFRRTAQSHPKFSYLNQIADHIKLVAHVPVRNIGTIAGNLSIKHTHNEFPSDIFILLEAAGAILTIVNAWRQEEQHSVLEYLSLNMNNKVIKNISLPGLPDGCKYRSYKIMQRAQNAHAIVSAAFLLDINAQQEVQWARILYGGINPSFNHATVAEQYLLGKQIFDNATLQGVFRVLDQTLQADNVLPQPSPEFRKQLAIALFYKFVLSIAPAGKIRPNHRSGGSTLSRPISNGTQEYQTNRSLYPLTKPITRMEALGQASGELDYITDMPDDPSQLYAYFVTANAPANSIVTEIDPSDALKLEGVVAFYGKTDIPGPNNFIPPNANYAQLIKPKEFIPEELFCSGVVRYYHQPLGIIVANTQNLAEKAADLIRVTYAKGEKAPFLTIRQILKAGATDRIFKEDGMEPSRKGTNIKRVIKGTYDIGHQYHYYTETQACVVIPKYDGLDIYPSSQWMDIIQVSVASVLNIPENKINISVRRLGGGFGGKITRNALLCCATALAAYKLQKPVKMRMTFSTNMDIIGKRFPVAANYEVGVDQNGEIQYLDTDIYFDYGYGGNEPVISLAMGIFSESYNSDTWTLNGYYTNSDTHAGVWTRTPGSCNFTSLCETIMEHISMELNIAPLDTRLVNMSKTKNESIIHYVDELRKFSDYDNRLSAIELFNKSNRWIKKGLSLIPLTYPLTYAGGYHATVAIYAGDGSVAVTHGGIEMGQGIHTKVAQVCAHALNVPLDMVSVKSSNNMASANDFLSGSSFTSESACFATLRTCEILLERIKPVRDQMKNPTWQQLIKECQEQYVDLVASYMRSPNDRPQSYLIYAACAAEVQVDILTGARQITRVDILEDSGTSINPLIDIGQVEGAFVMGLGYWTTEKTVYSNDGRLLTNRTWDYKIPGALDIPVDFRVKFPKSDFSTGLVLHSKTCSEAPFCLSFSVLLAVKRAVASARAEADPNAPKWYRVDGPADIENTFMNSLNYFRQYTL